MVVQNCFIVRVQYNVRHRVKNEIEIKQDMDKIRLDRLNVADT